MTIGVVQAQIDLAVNLRIERQKYLEGPSQPKRLSPRRANSVSMEVHTLMSWK